MSAKLSKELEKIKDFKTKESNNTYYNSTFYNDEDDEENYRKYRNLHGKTIMFSKTVVLVIFSERPDCENLLEDREFYFLQDIEYSENKMSYDEDMNLLIDNSPSDIIESLTKILKKLI